MRNPPLCAAVISDHGSHHSGEWPRRLVRLQETKIKCIFGLQSIPRESNDKGVAAMLDELTIEANEESFIVVLQHGGNNVTWKRSIVVKSQEYKFKVHSPEMLHTNNYLQIEHQAVITFTSWKQNKEVISCSRKLC